MGLVDQLSERVSLFCETEDPDIVLEPRFEAMARALERRLRRPGKWESKAKAAEVLAWSWWSRFEVSPTGADQDALDHAVAWFDKILFRAPGSQVPGRLGHYLGEGRAPWDDSAVKLVHRALKAQQEYGREGRLEELEVAIDLFRAALAVLPSRHPDRAATLADLGLALRRSFEETGSGDDLDEAIAYGRASMELTGPSHPDRAFHLSTLANSLQERFEGNGALDDLNEAIAAAREAAESTAEGRPGHRVYWSNLGNALRQRCEHTGTEADLNEAIRAGRVAVDGVPEDDPDRPMFLSNLALALRVSFERTGDPGHLNEAVRLVRAAVLGTPDDDPRRSSYLSHLGGALRVRYEQAGDAEELDEAVRVGRAAVAAAPAGDPEIPGHMSNLSLALWTRYERGGAEDDLDEAIRVGRSAVDGVPDGHPDRPIYLASLSLALCESAQQTGTPDHLDEAIRVGRAAVAATPDAHPDLPLHLCNLGVALRIRYEHAGDARDLDHAIEACRTAVDRGAPGRPDRHKSLTGLGLSLYDRFLRTGDEDDLDEALHFQRLALAAIPDDRPDRFACLSNLSLTLRSAYDRLRVRRDLDEAIKTGRTAVQGMPAGHRYRLPCLTSLGIALQVRYELDGRDEDLEEAIRVGRAAVQDTPEHHPDTAMNLSNLGLALQSKFDHTIDRSCVDEAVELARASVRAAAPSDPELPGYRSNLGLALEARFEHAGLIRDHEDAEDAMRAAVETTPADHPDHAMYALNLARVLHAGFRRTRVQQAMNEAAGHTWSAANTSTADTDVRLRAAYQHGLWHWQNGDPAAAARGFDLAVTLLPQIAWQGLDRNTQEEGLANWNGLVSDAVACVLEAGDPFRAVELAEQGRSVLWTQTLRMRGDLTRLAEAHPDVATRLREIREVLDRPAEWLAGRGVRRPGAARPTEEELWRRRRLAREWDALVETVRRLPGFASFLASRPFADLRKAAADGPVVMVNTSRLGCHAVVITTGGPGARVVRLPDLTHQEAVRQANLCLAVTVGDQPDEVTDTEAGAYEVPADREGRSRALAGVLDWLYRTVTGPVQRTLAEQTGDGELTRIWWCPIGVLAFLPLHAADQRVVPEAEATPISARTVSSYAPTLTALIRARAAERPTTVRQLVVGLAKTPDRGDLPAVRREVRAIGRHLPAPERSLHVIDHDATAARVLAELPRFPWVHLACHATTDERNPAECAFLLWDWHEHPLSLAELVALRLDLPDLAFLAACETSRGTTRLSEESVHLAAALQVIGYRHVIAALWPVKDVLSPRLADAVYASLTGGAGPDSSRAAWALHDAVERVRARHPHDPLMWAPFVHFGP